jgi:hypothetical protein
MKAKRIKKIMFGVLLSDGSLDTKTQRFDLYSKNKQYAEYLQECFSNLTHTRFSSKEVFDKRFGVTGYKVWSTRSKYLTKMYNIFYPNNGRKVLTTYIVDRLDAEALAHVWMCDGYLEHAKNRKTNKIQNIGWFCLESFPKEELELLQSRLDTFGISSSLVKKPWGFGYRIRIGGENLQRFISLVYSYILDCFQYKTVLFYKLKSTALELPSAEHYVKTYSVVDDIVRYSKKLEKTTG